MTELTDVLDAVQARVSYLRCHTDAVAGHDGWSSCAELIADPVRMRAEIDATAAGRGTDDPQVLASVYAQSYAFRIPSVAVAAWALGLPVPSTAPDTTLVRITRHRPGELATTDHDVRELSAAELVHDVVDRHLEPFLASVRAGTRIGERLLWGNVAASITTIFRAVQSSGANSPATGDAAVRARADEFFAAAPRLAAQGRWSTLTVPGALGWYWDRSSCCLWYQTSGGSMCDDCSLADDDERTGRRRAELTATAEGASA